MTAMNPPHDASLEPLASHDDDDSGTVRSPLAWAVDGANAFGSLLIFAIMLLILADVASRNVFNRPIHGVAELVGMSVIVVVFSQLASAVRHHRMARADIFIDGFRVRHPRAGALVCAVFNAAGMFACGLLGWATLAPLAHAWRSGEFLGTAGLFTTPTWPLYAAVVAGSVLAVVQYAVLTVADVADAARHRKGAPS